MPVDIHGKMYVTVAERVQALHAEKSDRAVSITTEFLPSNNMIVCKATVQIGDRIFTGTSAANPTKAIEKQSPYEVAETSAVGRALGFAGYGIAEGIASADEMIKAGMEDKNGTKGGSVLAKGTQQTDSTPDPIMDATEPMDIRFCTQHGEEMTPKISKNGKKYYSHLINGKHCFGSSSL